MPARVSALARACVLTGHAPTCIRTHTHTRAPAAAAHTHARTHTNPLNPPLQPHTQETKGRGSGWMTGLLDTEAARGPVEAEGCPLVAQAW